jgi:hypothetical protein
VPGEIESVQAASAPEQNPSENTQGALSALLELSVSNGDSNVLVNLTKSAIASLGV